MQFSLFILLIVPFLTLNHLAWSASRIYNTTVESIQYGHQTIPSIQNCGTVTLNGTTVTGEVTINGSLEANQAYIGSFHVNGRTVLNDCIVDNASGVNGSLTCIQSVLKQPVFICSHKVTFSSCHVDSIVLRFSPDDRIIQQVELSGSSTVFNDIIFEEGKGEVILKDSSQVLGKVIGGIIIRR